jgi:hypothetical protein
MTHHQTALGSQQHGAPVVVGCIGVGVDSNNAASPSLGCRSNLLQDVILAGDRDLAWVEEYPMPGQAVRGIVLVGRGRLVEIGRRFAWGLCARPALDLVQAGPDRSEVKGS